jgi:predicted RNA-binding protein with PIN domain
MALRKAEETEDMPYLVDGNNVMAQIVGWHRDKAKARRKLIHSLAQFVKVHRAKVQVVFDGSPDDEFPEGHRYKSVRIFYARPGSDADSRIKDLVGKSSFAKDITVVSSDRALSSSVKAKGAKVIASGRFRRMLDEAGIMASQKYDQNEPVDVDEWLEFFESNGN